MARYKDVDYSQDKFIPVSFNKQILPGTIEYTLSYLIDNELDLSIFDSRYHNDETGATAFDPAVLLKIVIYAYSRGITSSRKIEQAAGKTLFLWLCRRIRNPTLRPFLISDRPWMHKYSRYLETS